jgi:transcriptional regulator with XRE-family HTH domain
MMKNRSTADRVCYLIEHRWGGSQAEMAREVGCSQSTLSRMAHGEIQPGKRLLRLIAAVPGVHPEWLYHGRGKPLLPEEKRGKGLSVRLPVLRELTASPPKQGDHVELFPVAQALYAPSRCWYRLPESAAILRHEDAALRPDDRLLLDFDLSRFNTLFELSGKIAVACVPPAGRTTDRRLEIGVVEYYSGPEEEFLELVTGQPAPLRWKGVKPVQARLVAKDSTTGRNVDLGLRTVPAWVDSKGKITPVSSNELQPESYSIQPSDLIAVCVGMFRP